MRQGLQGQGRLSESSSKSPCQQRICLSDLRQGDQFPKGQCSFSHEKDTSRYVSYQWNPGHNYLNFTNINPLSEFDGELIYKTREKPLEDGAPKFELKCEHCGKEFRQMSLLRRHIRYRKLKNPLSSVNWLVSTILIHTHVSFIPSLLFRYE